MLAGTMRAVILEAPGQPLRLEAIPIPEPKSGEALVKVAACGVCHSDLHVIKNELAFPTPCVLGHEISGTVAALGPGTPSPPVGRRVVASFIMPCGSCRYCAQGRDDLCENFFALNRRKGVLFDGTTRLKRQDGRPLAMYSMAGLADYAVVPTTGVFPLPDELPLEDSAVLGCAVFTAYGAVRHGADLRVGERLAVVAVGGVGLSVIQVAKAFGASQIIAVDIRDDKLEAARSCGATHLVNSRTEDAVAKVRALTDGDGVDVAFEALGRPETFQQAVAMLREGGRMVAVGLAPGQAAAEVEITRLVRRSLRLIGSYGARTRSDMPQLLRLAAQGSFRPEKVVTRRYSLEQAEEAYRALDRGDIVGRAIVVP